MRTSTASSAVVTMTDSHRSRERLVWSMLTVFALTWGVLTGLAFGCDDYFLHPATAVYGCLGIAALSAVAFVSGRTDEARVR